MENHYPYEKLGLFYLGRELDMDNGKPSAMPLLLKNKNLTTHAAIIGMTGSGKTGLGIGLIEEAIMDNVPSIIIDPKGDMGNLLLTFPELLPEDFLPWVDSTEAAKKEMSRSDYAKNLADTWRDGLESWGQGRERIANLRTKTDFTIYTPGSTSGVPVSVLNSFQAPSTEILADLDTLNNLVNSTTTSLLVLVDVVGDPLQSKEHILVSSILLHFWRRGENLNLENIIGHIVSPPFDKVGIFGLDTFYPQPERMKLAMRLNNVLASPTFSTWIQGVPLDIQRILYGEDGKPKTAIFSISHLSEAERMFFVTMLLNQFVSWMRRQQGSSSLKALLYMDEIFGYFPPTANPPSKKPMLLLLKQARAYGVGVVLATQNPVDLDYKGLSNIGSWFIGRLQTSQDQQRVVDGIVGASDGKLEKKTIKKLLSGLKGRQFLLNSAHLDMPLLFETRWVLSYLKGPISNRDIKKLMTGVTREESLSPDEIFEKESSTSSFQDILEHPPMISGKITQLYHLHSPQSENKRLEPWMLCQCSLRFFNAKRNIDRVTTLKQRIYLDDSFLKPDWEGAEQYEVSIEDCVYQAPAGASFYPLAPLFSQIKDLRECTRSFSNYVYQTKKLPLFRAVGLKIESQPDESLADFRIRVADRLRDAKEEAIDKLKDKYQVRQKRLESQIQRAVDKIEKEKVDVKARTTDTLLSFGSAVLGAFFGRKAVSAATLSKASTGIRNVGRLAKEKGEVKRAEQTLASLHEDMDSLALEVEAKVDELSEKFDLEKYTIEEFAITPRRCDVFDVEVVLLWDEVVV